MSIWNAQNHLWIVCRKQMRSVAIGPKTLTFDMKALDSIKLNGFGTFPNGMTKYLCENTTESSDYRKICILWFYYAFHSINFTIFNAINNNKQKIIVLWEFSFFHWQLPILRYFEIEFYSIRAFFFYIIAVIFHFDKIFIIPVYRTFNVITTLLTINIIRRKVIFLWKFSFHQWLYQILMHFGSELLSIEGSAFLLL